MLRLAHDYDIIGLRNECDRYLADKLESSKKDEDFAEYLVLADRYNISDTATGAVDQLSRLKLKDLKGLKQYKDISPETMCKILEKHIEKGTNIHTNLLVSQIVESRYNCIRGYSLLQCR